MSVRVLLTALLLGGCASYAPAFDPRFGDNDDERSEGVLKRLAQPGDGAPEALSLVATTEGAPQALIAADFDHGLRFRTPVDAESRPERLGDLVLVAARGELRAHALRDGTLRWSRPLAGCARYLGAARDGDLIAFACEAPEGSMPNAASAPSLLRALAASDGRQRWQRMTPDALGRPAASHGLLLVPWQRQGLAVLDARDGVELARLRSRDDVIDWVRSESGFAWFGHRDAYLIGPRGYSGSRKDAVSLNVPAESLPGRPPLVESAFAPLPGKRSAHGRVALSVAPALAEAQSERSTGLVAGDDRVYFTFYRYVFAYDGGGVLRWARTLAHDVIATHSLDGGLAIATDAGELLMLSAQDGAERARRDLGVQLAAASLSGHARVPATGEGAPALRRGLLEVALDIDQRLVPARAYAINQLARLAAPEVTADLLHIYGRSTTPPELQRVVADALRTRRSGLEYVVDALLERYDFIEQTRPAPLAVLVPALLDARETRSVPNLVARMLDHETPLAVLGAVVHAVVELGDQRVVDPLLSLLRWYRADSSFAEQPDALIEAARGVLRHGGDAGAQQLAELTRDGIVTPALAGEVATLLAPKPTPEQIAVAAAAHAPPPRLPAALGPQQLRATFDRHADDLRTCLQPELERNAKLAQVRLALIVEADGSTHALQVAPGSSALADCLYPKLASVRFPRFRSGRQVATYVLPAHPPTPSASPDAAATTSDDGEFWALQAAHPRALGAMTEPWWHSKQSIAALAFARSTQDVIDATSKPAQLAPSTPAAPAAAVPASTTAAPTAVPATAPPAGTTPAATPTPATPPAAEDHWWAPANKPAAP